MILRVVSLLIAVGCAGVASFAQEGAAPCRESATFIGKGDVTAPVEYEELSVAAIGGRVSGSLVPSSELKGLPQICLSLFTEGKHKFVGSAVTDGEGSFLFRDVPAGRYRIVIRAPGFYVADVPVRLLKKAKKTRPADVVLHSLAMQQRT